MPINGYFDTVFAEAGNVVVIPDEAQGNGSVSYTEGFGILYSTAVASGGLNFPRGQFNQLMKDVTTAIQYQQQHGAPPFITTEMNGGVDPFEYTLGAIVSYDASTEGPALLQNWVSTASDNTTVPGDPGAFWQPINGRRFLKANTTFYVSTTGSDTTGTGSISAPWQTIQFAVDYIKNNIELSGYTATIQVADGTYTGGVNISGGWMGSGRLQLQGNLVTPSSVDISTTAATAISFTDGAVIYVAGFKLQTASSGHCLQGTYNSVCHINGGMVFGATPTSSYYHINLTDGSRLLIDSNYTISGNSTGHLFVANNSEVAHISAITVTVSGTPAFTEFANSTVNSSIVVNGSTYSGSATGTRYSVTLNGVINTGGGGASFFPGNSAGSSATGGQYA